MSSQRSTKPLKPPNQSQTQTQNPSPSTRSSTSSLSTHLAMVELKQRILTSLSKLSDRDTHQIAVEDLEKTVQTLHSDAIPMLLNCLYDASAADPKPAVKKESLRLIAAVCDSHPDAAGPHLPKILSHIIRRLKDADSGVRDACRDAVGALAAQYLDSGAAASAASGPMAGLFVRPMFEAMAEQNKSLQGGAALCLARAVECAADPPVAAFQKLCPRICKLLNSPNFLAKASLLPVISSLAQVGAIAPQSLENLLQSVHDCLGSSDWATRKAAADGLIALALHSRNLIISHNTAPTLAVLEASRFDKIKPVRESMTEALQLWKNISGKVDGAQDDLKASSNENRQPNDNKDERKDPSAKDSPNSARLLDSENKPKTGTEKAAVILKKKLPALTDKELNPEFFQNLETRGSGDFPVEVVVPRRYQLSSSIPNNEEEPEKSSNSDPKGRLNRVVGNEDPMFGGGGGGGGKYRNLGRDKWPEERIINGRDSRTRAMIDGGDDPNLRESSSNRAGFSKNDAQSEGSFGNNKGSWLAIQRQLLQLERQQSHLMNMLQDFMGGSHDSMITLENRVRGLERVVEDMARDLSISSGLRRVGGGGGGGGGSNSFGLGFNGFPDYSGGSKFGRPTHFGDRFGSQSDGVPPPRWDFPSSYGGNGSSRNGSNGPGGSSRRGLAEKAGGGPGPSARSVWQASKDEATLEAIRVAGDDSNNNNNGSGSGRPGPELARPEPELADGGEAEPRERDPVRAAWANAMDALHAGDVDTAYAEVLSTGDDLLLVKLMDRTGPVIDQLSNEVANETLHAVVQFFAEQDLFDICLSWAQQLAEIVMEHGEDILGISMEMKREILLNLQDASLSMDPPEDWEGATPDQIVMQLASSWQIDLQHNNNNNINDK